ncbi:MAG: hypothetical protein V4650_01870 [Pseudomonadota bacterium]
MPRKSTNKKAPSVKPALKKPVMKFAQKTANAKKRGARGHVRAAILDSLATGPKTGKQLRKAGKFSAASFYLNLKQLENEGRIVLGGRGLPIRLAGSEPAAPDAKVTKSLVPASKPKAVSRLAVMPEYVSGDLQDALEAVSARFVAPDRIGEKLHALEQLSLSLPAPVAEVLLAIRADLLRLSPARQAVKGEG